MKCASGGFKVGEVKHISLTKDNDPKHPPYYILIAFTVPERYSIREDAKIRIDGTLTGTSWLNFEEIGKGNPLLGKRLVGRRAQRHAANCWQRSPG